MLALRDLMRPVGEHNVLQPVCPICSRPLRLSRTAARAGDLAEHRTYGCTGCGVWLTETAQESMADSAD
jgi:transposase-like protein